MALGQGQGSQVWAAHFLRPHWLPGWLPGAGQAMDGPAVGLARLESEAVVHGLWLQNPEVPGTGLSFKEAGEQGCSIWPDCEPQAGLAEGARGARAPIPACTPPLCMPFLLPGVRGPAFLPPGLP